MKVLYLEDDLMVGDSFVRMLEMRGFDVYWVKTVREAREVISQEEFDAGVLDGKLPDGLGSDILPLDFPAIILTGDSRPFADCEIPVLTKGIRSVDEIFSFLADAV